MTLQELAQNQNAIFSPENSKLPLHFGDPQQEYAAAHQSAVLIDLGQRTQIEITGEDRAKFLHNFCTNNINVLEPGFGCEAFFLNVKGKTLGHGFLFATENAIWLESATAADEKLMPHLDRYIITEDVTLTNRTSELRELLLVGPQAEKLLNDQGFLEDTLEPLQHRTFSTNGETGQIRKANWLHLPAFLLCASEATLTTVWEQLTTADATPTGTAIWHTLRIESLFPLYGQDITEDQLAPELNRNEQAINYTKGCYLGQEPIARIDAMGHVNRKLVGLQFQEGDVPALESKIFSTTDNKEVGWITSAVSSAKDSTPIAMGYLRSNVANADNEVQVGEQTANVFV